MVAPMRRVKRSQRKALLAAMVVAVVPPVVLRILDMPEGNVFSSTVLFLIYLALISGTYYAVLYFTLDPELRPTKFALADLGPEERPAAWHLDPAHEHDWRYWDGNAWTQHVSDAGRVSDAPLATVPSTRFLSAGRFSKYQYRINLWTLEHPWLMAASMALFMFVCIVFIDTVVVDDPSNNPIRDAIVFAVTYTIFFAPSYRWGAARRRTETSVQRYREMHPVGTT